MFLVCFFLLIVVRVRGFHSVGFLPPLGLKISLTFGDELRGRKTRVESPPIGGFSGTTDPLRSGKQSLETPTQIFDNEDARICRREVLLWNRMKAKSFVTKDLVTLGIYQFDSSRLAWSTKIHSGHSNLTSPRRKVQEAPCWCGELHQITRWVAVVVDPFPFKIYPLKNTWEVLNTQFQLFTAEEDIQSFLLEA